MITHPNRSRARKVAVETPKTYDHDRDYAAFRASVQMSFDIERHAFLFETDAENIYDTYMGALASDQQVHSCNACKQFLNRFGGLVSVTDTGATVPVMWRCDDVPEFYKPVVTALRTKLKGARIVRPFYTSSRILGIPQTGKWEHFCICDAPVFNHALLKPGQLAAAKKEDFRTVASALSDFTAPMLDEALRLLESDHLHRSERFIKPVKWLRELHNRPKGRAGENLLWRAIVTAPNGFCHPRASVIGSLLEDIQNGYSFDDVKRRFDAKVAPLTYQRPQAAPSAGNIKVAEAIFEKMGLAPALERRFARLDECVTIWKPSKSSTPTTGGIFGHLQPKQDISPELNVPDITMTWTKFASTVLPNAQEMHMHVPTHGNFTALVTACYEDVPPLLKWDRDDKRNQVSWYVYHGGSQAINWKLTGGWTNVTGIVPSPTLWGDDPKGYLGDGVSIILEGAVDTKKNQGNALFPECLRGELHQVRSVIEAYSRRAELTGREQASACGYKIDKGLINIRLRVVTNGKTQGYKIDRWD